MCLAYVHVAMTCNVYSYVPAQACYIHINVPFVHVCMQTCNCTMASILKGSCTRVQEEVYKQHTCS